MTSSPADETTAALDLIAFLNARLREDEAAARDLIESEAAMAEWSEPASGVLLTGPPTHDDVWAGTYGIGDSRITRFIATHDPARVLREVEAKRKLITFALENAAEIDGEWGCCHKPEEIASGLCGYSGMTAANGILRPLAAVYRSHPDYQQEWAR